MQEKPHRNTWREQFAGQCLKKALPPKAAFAETIVLTAGLGLRGRRK